MSPLSRLSILSAVILFSGNLSIAQKVMKLEDCIQMALEKNIEIKRQRLQISLAKNNLQTSRASQLPGINASYSHNLSSGKTVNYEDYSYINTQYQDGSAYIQGTFQVFSGFSTWNQNKSNKYSLQSESEKQEELKKAITMKVTSSYLQILLSEELLGLAEAKLLATKEQLRINEGYFESGRLSKVEVFAMKAQEAQDNLARIQAENDVRTAYLSLVQFLNMEDGKELNIQKPVNLEERISSISDLEQVYAYARTNHRGISAAEYTMKSRESALAVEKAKISPTISLNGFLYSRYSELGVNQLDPSAPYPYTSQLKDNLYSQASMRISIPIFNQLSTRNLINQARIQCLDAKLSLDQKKLSVRQDIQTAWSAALNALAKYEASAEVIASANESFNLVQEKYRAGISSSADYKVAQNQLLQAQTTQIQSKYECIILNKILDLYLDKPITLE